MRKVSRRQAALCAAVAGAFCVVSGVSATTVYMQSDLVDTGGAPQFVAMVDADLHRPPVIRFAWGKALAKGPSLDVIDLPTTDAFDRFAVFGRDSSGGVFVTFSNGSAGIGQSFSNLFPGISETQLADALLLSPDSQVVTDFATLLAQTPGNITPMGTATAQVTHFSNGANYGTIQASFTPIPEPGCGALIAGAASLLIRRRRVTD